MEIYAPIPEELLHRTPRAVRIAIRIAIRIAVVGVVLAALTVVIARHESGPAARHADLFGRATFQRDRSYSFVLGLPSRFGPGHLRVRGRDIVIPPHTPLYGACTTFEYAGLSAPCFVQVGLQPETMTAKWVLGLYLTGRAKQPLPIMKGKIRRVISRSIEFADGTVLPYRSMPIITRCIALPDRGQLRALSGRNVEIGVDAQSGEVKTIQCLVTT